VTQPAEPAVTTLDHDADPACHSRLHRTLQEGRFAVTAELGPPRGASLEAFRGKVRLLEGWIDAANVADMPPAVDGLASWAGSLATLHVGVEPVLQLQCRGRDRTAVQADLLGAAALHIRNIVLLTGEHQPPGGRGEALRIDPDSTQLIWMTRTLRDEGRLLSGRRLSTPPRWLIGAVEDPFAAPRQYPLERLRKKIAAGVRFVQTQPVFDLSAFVRWVNQLQELGLSRRCYVLAGVAPIRSLEALEELRRTRPETGVPAHLVGRLHGVPAHRFAEEGLAVCAESVRQLRAIPGVAGVHIMASGWEEAIPEILERAGLDRRVETAVLAPLTGRG